MQRNHRKILIYSLINSFICFGTLFAQITDENGFQIYFPPDWASADQLPQGYENGFKKTLGDGLSATVFVHHEIMPSEAGDPPSNTSDMESQWDQMVRNQYSEVSIMADKRPKVNGRILINRTYLLTDNGDNVRRRYTYFFTKSRTVFIVQCSAPPALWTSVLPDFDTMAASIRASGSSRENEGSEPLESAVAKMKSGLNTLAASFPGMWGCSIADISLGQSSSQSLKSVDISLSYSRDDIGNIYRATRLLFGMMKKGGNPDISSDLPPSLQKAGGESSNLIRYIGQLWGCAFGYVANCKPKVGLFRLIILNSEGKKLGAISISRQKASAVLNGKITADDMLAVANMYSFE